MRPYRTAARATLCLVFGLAPSLPTRAGPADPLLKLVPHDASVTVAVEDLRGRARELAASPLVRSLRETPAVADWLASDRFQGFRQGRDKAEKVFGVPFAAVRDGLLGEAFVLAFRLPPGGLADEARGLLLMRVPDRAFLDRLTAGLSNTGREKDRELERVIERRRGRAVYHVREFGGGRRPPEFYAALDDRVFAWTNSEDLLLGVIDRQAGGGGGLDASPGFRAVREGLPDRALVSVFVDPRLPERLIAAERRAPGPDEKPALDVLGRYLAGVRYAGAALEWSRGPVLHVEESIDPEKFPPARTRGALRGDRPGASLRRVPATALAFACMSVDFAAVFEALNGLVSDRERPRVENLVRALGGLLLGLDPKAEVLPHLGPGVLAYVERPGDDAGRAVAFPAVLAVDVGGPPRGGVAAAIENALRTFLALYALDDAHGGGRLRVETSRAGNATVTALDAESPLAFAGSDGRITVGTTADAVRRAIAAGSNARAGDRVARLRDTLFPGATGFACVDLRAVRGFADGRRNELARWWGGRLNRPEADAARDLDRGLALAGLFDAAFLSGTVAPDFRRVHHTLGFVLLGPSRP